MFQYRQILVQTRQGDTDRDIARAGLMGRRKAAELRELAWENGAGCRQRRCPRMLRSSRR
jgi:hypothetical protein